MMNQYQQSYLEYRDRARSLIGTQAEDPLYANALINKTYLSISKENPYFIWFSGGALGSAKVGENLFYASIGSVGTFNNNLNLKAILENLPNGNQSIFTDILASYLVYREHGINVIDSLVRNELIHPLLSDAFKIQSKLEENAFLMSKEMDLSLNDPRVISAVFAQEENILLAREAAIAFMMAEQAVVQKMYIQSVITALTDPLAIKAGEALKLTGVEVNGEFYSFAKEVQDPSDYGQRVAYFEKVLTAIAKTYSNEELRAKYLSQVEQAVNKIIDTINPHTPNQFHDSLSYTIEKQEMQPQHDEFRNQIEGLVSEFLNQNLVTLQNSIEKRSEADSELSDIETDTTSWESIDYTVIDLPANNISVHFMDKESFRNSGLFNVQIMGNGQIKDYIPIQSQSWVGGTLKIFEVSGNFIYYDLAGEQRGLPFPLLLDQGIGKFLSTPLDQNGHDSSQSSLDIVLNNPELFSQPSHLNYNNVYQLYHHLNFFNNALLRGMQQGGIHKGFITQRMEGFRKIGYGDVLESDSKIDFSNMNKRKFFDTNSNQDSQSAESNIHTVGSVDGTLTANRLCRGGAEVHICLNLEQPLYDKYASGAFDSNWYLETM